MSAAYIFTERWMMGVAVCQIWIGVDYTASTASILNLFILSLDRYWSVRQPLKYLHKRTKRRALSMIAVVWVISSLWIIPIASWHYFAHGGVRTVPENECDTEYAKNSLFKVITAFFNFYLPLTVMFILYFRIFIAIRKRSKFELGHRYPGGTVISFKSSNNVATMQSLDDSDSIGLQDDDEGRPSHNIYFNHQAKELGRSRCRQNGTRNTVPNGCRQMRMMTASGSGGRGGRGRGGMNFVGMRGGRGGGGASKKRDLASSSGSGFKVEYIYDENVMDPQTEKIERYFYEDSYPLSRLNRTRWTCSNINNDTKTVCANSSSRPISMPASSSSALPCNQRSVRFHSNVRAVHEPKISQRSNLSPLPYRSESTNAESTSEYHQQQHKPRQQQQQQQQQPPHDHFVTVGGKTTAVAKRTLFRRQKHLDENHSSKGAKSNDKPRLRLKLEAFRKHKPAETSFSPNLTVNVSSSLSSSSASTFGDSVEGKWGVETVGGHGGTAEGGCAGCGTGSTNNCRVGGGCCVLIDDQIRLETPNIASFANHKALVSSPSQPDTDGLRVHRGKDLSTSGNLGARGTVNSLNISGQNSSGMPPKDRGVSNGCCSCRCAKNDNDDDDEDDDEDELSSFSLNTRSDSKNRRSAGSSVGGAAGGMATSSGSLSGGVSGLKERLKTMRQSSSLNKEIKAARQLGVIMGAFTLCFLPYFILYMVVAFCDDCVSPGHVTTATWVGYLNSTLNPFLYPLCNANFRSKFRSMLSCCGNGRGVSGRSGGRFGIRHRNHEFARTTVYHSRYD
ncbi:inosine-5'-monophosphate dehydrogenase [Plakobranchus ocellatus]|uniref:Inosine-5'-monophosphate dehydrogenase n=1 Tax=Plakobranchus ocellatus TaxID=259542 RepID=A0AAV4DJC0_9GAST|nr:inosine-5'-monophosphate dehydrogenase [Plakobranchus ocellatus]